MRPSRFVPALLITVLPGVALAQAMPPQIPLWNHGERPIAPGGACAKGDLPMGPPTAQGRSWKEPLLAWFHGVNAARVTIANPPPDTVAPDVAWGLANAGSGPNNCINQLANSGGSQPYMSQIESIYLNATGGEWGGDAQCRMNADETHFLPANLASQGDCRVHVPSYYMDPGLSSWANMSFTGNPYAQQPLADHLKTRGAMWLITHLFIADYLWWSSSAGGVLGSFPCDRQFCPQAHATLSASGRVLPGPIHNQGPVDYDDYDGLPVFNFDGDYSMHVFDEAGALLAHYAESYLNVRTVFGHAEQVAVEEALLTFAERVHSMGRWSQMVNMAHRNPVALWIAADAQQDPMARSYAMWLYDDLRDFFYDPNNGLYQPQGTFRQLSGFDTGYHMNDMLNLARLSWAERYAPSQPVTTAARAAFDLWGHLMLPDIKLGNGSKMVQPVAPTAFNSRTGRSMADAIGPVVSQRFFLGATSWLPWAWAEMVHFTYDLTTWDPYYAFIGAQRDPWAGMACDNFSYLGNSVATAFHHRFGNAGGYPLALDNTPPRFPDPEVPGYVSRFYDQPNFAFLYGDHSMFTTWDFVSMFHVDQRMPYEMPPPYYHNINDAFFFAHTVAAAPTNEMTAIVHAGFVGANDEDGFGGGELAGLWSPTAGVLSLSRRRGHNYGGAANDDMSQWREMPMHAVSMVDPNKHWTSSSRIAVPQVFEHNWADFAPEPADAFNLFALNDGRDIEKRGCDKPTIPSPKNEAASVTLVANTTAQMIRVCGDIPDTAFNEHALSRPIPYQRDFLISEGVVSVETRLRPTVNDPLAEAYETIPLYYGLGAEHPPGDFVVSLYANNGVVAWWPGQPAPPFTQVTRVKVTRFSGAMVIDFPTPRRVTVSRDSWSGNHGDSWNLLIDLLAGQPSLGNTTTQYQITIL